MSEEQNDHSGDVSGSDPCAVKTPAQRYAFLWFVSMILIGGWLTYFLADTDFKLWKTDGRMIDYDKYRENRLAATGLGSDQIDERTRASLSASVSELSDK